MRIQVIGAGSWGLALARLLANNGNDVALWCRDEDDPGQLRATREQPDYLPGVKLPGAIDVTRAVDPDTEMAVLAVPSHAMRAVLENNPLGPHTAAVSVAKGIENNSLMRMSEVIAETAGPRPVAALSGPSHAEEVAHDLPASVVIASEDAATATLAQTAFFCKHFRVYTSPDLTGVELGGALKNVVAIAAGACDGLALGDNAKAALLTRGLAEISRLGRELGADPLTFAGLSGMGDLFVTCTSRHSRNRRLGEAIATGRTLEEYTATTRMVAEGVRTTRSAHALAHHLNVDMPITRAVHQTLFEGVPVREVLDELLIRGAKPERA